MCHNVVIYKYWKVTNIYIFKFLKFVKKRVFLNYATEILEQQISSFSQHFLCQQKPCIFV